MKTDSRKLNLVTVFGLGHLRPFPGTWGSLPSVVLAGVLIAVGLGPGPHPVIFNAVLIAVLVFFTLACAVLGGAFFLLAGWRLEAGLRAAREMRRELPG